MKILNFEKFLEVNLNLGELSKSNNNGDLRGDILIKKIKNLDPITTDSNRNIIITKMINDDQWVENDVAINNIIDKDGKYDNIKSKEYFIKNNRYKKIILGSDGNEYSLNQLKKTKDFGSIGPGSKTGLFESLQCVFFGIKQLNPGIILNKNNFMRYYLDYLNKHNDSVFLNDKITVDIDLISEFKNDPNWIYTFCKIPNRMWIMNDVRHDIKYLIYHTGYNKQDSPYVSIYKKYKEFAKSCGFSDINIAKYCPADVYLISSEYSNDIINDISNTKTMDELTRLIDGLFYKKLLIPISLKKINGNSFKIITNKEINKELPNFFIRSFIIGSDMKGIGSKISTTSVWKHKNDKEVDITNRILNFDSSDTSKNQDIDGEVEGGSSRHGKISFKSIKRLLDIYDSDNYLMYNYDLRKLTISELCILVKNMISDINNIKDKIGIINISPINRGSDISNNENKLISRIQSMQVIKSIAKIYMEDKNKANDLITKIIRFALSIQTDKFDTPRYFRVI